MCRLYGFRSAIYSGVHQSLVAAENAMALQSRKHCDGWGIAYYIDKFPHLIRNDQQALSDDLFREISAVVSTRTFLSHIRLATFGNVRVLNCHPFQHGCWSFAHNGELGSYGDDDIREQVVSLVDPRFRRHLLGDTDSEVLFHIFLSRLARIVENIQDEGVQAKHVLAALRDTMRAVRGVATERDPKRPNRLSFLVTNGNIMVGVRYRKELHFSSYKTACPERSTCFAYEASKCEAPVSDGIVKHLIVASEPIGEGPNVWESLADGEFVCVGHGMYFHRGWIDEVS